MRLGDWMTLNCAIFCAVALSVTWAWDLWVDRGAFDHTVLGVLFWPPFAAVWIFVTVIPFTLPAIALYLLAVAAVPRTLSHRARRVLAVALSPILGVPTWWLFLSHDDSLSAPWVTRGALAVVVLLCGALVRLESLEPQPFRRSTASAATLSRS